MVRVRSGRLHKLPEGATVHVRAFLVTSRKIYVSTNGVFAVDDSLGSTLVELCAIRKGGVASVCMTPSDLSLCPVTTFIRCIAGCHCTIRGRTT